MSAWPWRQAHVRCPRRGFVSELRRSARDSNGESSGEVNGRGQVSAGDGVGARGGWSPSEKLLRATNRRSSLLMYSRTFRGSSLASWRSRRFSNGLDGPCRMTSSWKIVERTIPMGRALGDLHGAVMVEFIVAFLPLMIFFEALLQFGGIVTGKLVVNHAAVCAARAAVVVLPDDPKFYDDVPVGQPTGKRREDIERAAAVPLAALKSFEAIRIKFPSQPGATDDRTSFSKNELVVIRVEADYHCQVPLVNRLLCNAATSKRTLVAEASFPNQGAPYPFPSWSDLNTKPKLNPFE